ncbi:MAG TPA: molybdopterin-dependent oxidoreductase [Propionibacteriaceae bacterium]|nr:molybdopterin-dependent oxidoreductase [Propionibacteriaceae bacterium]
MDSRRTADSRVSLARAGWVGVAAVAVAMGVGHLVAALTEPSASPVVALAARVIDASPKPLKDWAVAALGTLDKPVLLAGVMAVAVGLGVVAGRLSSRRMVYGWALVGGLGGVVIAAAVVGPNASVRSVLPGVAAMLAGGFALWRLLPLAEGPSTNSGTENGGSGTWVGGGPSTGSGTERPGWGSGLGGSGTGAAGDFELAEAEASRRRLLLGVAGTISLGLISGVAGALVPPSKQFRIVTLPTAARPLPPPVASLPVEGMPPYLTPQDELYRVDINVAVPQLDAGEWRLDIDGMVDRPYSLTWDDLVGLEVVERDSTLLCVSNEVGGTYVGHVRWRGVRTKDLLARAGVKPGADMVLSTSTDSFTVSTPLEALIDDREALIAIGMNGELLTAEHGFPARLVTPGLYGFVGATKWLRRLTVTRFEDRTAYWTTRGWSDRAPIKLASRIATPASFRPLKPGPVAIGGTAWASRVVVSKVEVRIDGGAWQEATLGPDGGVDSWRQWYLTWDATPGAHTIECRAWSADGKVQSVGPVPVDPDGPEGYHLLKVQVGA